MALRPALLIAAAAAALAAVLAFGMAAAAPSARAGCVRCHAEHFREQGTCAGCHRGNPSASRANLAHERLLSGGAATWGMPDAGAVTEGERLRDALGCRRCHVTGGTGNAYAISLDQIAWRRTQAQLRKAILEPASFMPDFSLTNAQADALIAVLLRDGERDGRESRYLVRFTAPASAAPGAFATRCGGCHRALTPAGPLGTSSSGPNLSGLLTPHYPDSSGTGWTRARLERWLQNPRAERPAATMRPVTLDDAELAEVLGALGPAPAR